MAKIGLVIRPGVQEALKCAEELIAWSKAHSHQVMLEQQSQKLLGLSGKAFYREEISTQANPIVTLGGDGTLIGVARYVDSKAPIIIGVNFGSLGFLTEITPKQLLSVLDEVLSDKAVCGERNMLYCEVFRDGASFFSSQAVNDAVIQKGVREKMLELDLAVNDEEVVRVRGDGLIVATPTGSTAYSLAAGGSIVYPSLEVVLITPICPHALTNRPFILPLDRTLKVTVPPYDGKVFLNVDGQVSIALQTNDVVKILRSKNKLRFARSPSSSYFEILRTKLNWGVGNKLE